MLSWGQFKSCASRLCRQEGLGKVDPVLEGLPFLEQSHACAVHVSLLLKLLSICCCQATIEVLVAGILNTPCFLPSAAKFHYQFNLKARIAVSLQLHLLRMLAAMLSCFCS